jgi:hypothetical protein
MFDDIRCEYPLPLPEKQGELAGRNWHENGFQTKDFDCLLDQYCLRKDGTLWQQIYDWGENSKGRPCRKPAGWQPMGGHTGVVRFYDFIRGNQADYWVEWAAVFAAGKVGELKLEQWEERDNRERLACEANWKQKEEERKRFLAGWPGRYMYPVYAWLVHGCFGLRFCKFWRWIGSTCDHIGWAIDRLGNKLAPYGDPIRAERRRRSFSKMLDED